MDTHIRTPSESPTGDAFDIFVPIGGGSPYTKRTGDRGNIPTTWPDQLGSAEIAHVAGHLFGFADEYHVELRNGVYFVVYDDPERIMSCPRGTVTPDELDVLIRAYPSP